MLDDRHFLHSKYNFIFISFYFNTILELTGLNQAPIMSLFNKFSIIKKTKQKRSFRRIMHHSYYKDFINFPPTKTKGFQKYLKMTSRSKCLVFPAQY